MTKDSKVYIGDGIYAEQGHFQGQVRLFTSDGVEEKNEIFLEAQELCILLDVIRTKKWMQLTKLI